MLSNLLKANLVKEEEVRIIDYNDAITEKLEAIRRQLLKDSGLLDEEEGGFMAGLSAPTVELEPQPDPAEELEKARAEAEEILKNARAEAQQIRSQAEEEAAQLKEQAREAGWQEGSQAGYEEGSRQAMEELESERQRIAQEDFWRQEDYRQRLEAMEKELVDVILEVVSHVTYASLVEKRDIVFHLVENALDQAEGSKQFLIHVSKEDYPNVAGKKEELLMQVPQSTELEIIKDATLAEGQCMIETDGGVFDCGLGTQMEGLVADIRALSMQ